MALSRRPVILTTLAGAHVPDLVGRGMATPEHLLRAGRLPVWLDLDLTASPEADRTTWLRRVTLDLTGLPPTIPEIDAFVTDRSAGA